VKYGNVGLNQSFQKTVQRRNTMAGIQTTVFGTVKLEGDMNLITEQSLSQ
jgi:hypothetical protein